MIIIENFRTRPKVTVLHAYEFPVDLRTPLGNPFTLRQYNNDRDLVIRHYFDYFYDRINKRDVPVFLRYLLQLQIAYERYRRLTLICWCWPLSCHAEVIRAHLLKDYTLMIQRGWGYPRLSDVG